MPRNAARKREDVALDVVKVRSNPFECVAPRLPVPAEAVRSRFERSAKHAGPPTVEWVSEVNLGPPPTQTETREIRRREEWRQRRKRMHCRTHVVQHTVGEKFPRPRTAANFIVRLEHSDVETVFREADRTRITTLQALNKVDSQVAQAAPAPAPAPQPQVSEF